MYRGAVVALHMVAIIAFAGGPASAKTPVPFDIEVSSSTVTPGDPVTVTVSSAATDLPDNVLTELVGLMPRSTDDEIIRPVTGHLEVRLVRIRPGVFQGSVDAPDPPGEYVIVPYPTATAWGTADVFPDPVFITVNRRPRLASRPTQLAVAVGLATAVIGLRRRRAARRQALRQRTIMRAGAAAAAVVTVVALAVFGADAFRDPGTVHVANQPDDCPVTIPSGDFVPPPPYPAQPAADGNTWYGTPELWTVLPVDGQYPTRKSVWWSAKFPGGQEEQRPDITVTWKRLDQERKAIVEDRGTNAHTTADGWFMIAGIDPDFPGCWQVTATYRGVELSYVYYRPQDDATS